jgi:acetyl-CoA C-acetyltransferase
MAAASQRAFEMTGSFDAARRLDGLMTVKVMSTYYPCAHRLLAERLELSPRFCVTSPIGGNSPQTLINRAAGMIARGELDSVLVAGAEAYRSRKRAKPDGGNRLFQGFPPDYAEDDIVGSTELETRHGMSLPIHGFPLYETALWAASGLCLEDYLKRVGTMWARFSRVAAGHPSAWTRVPLDAEAIVSPTAENRYIAFPYTKRMNPMVGVDLGAAVLLMAGETADRYVRKGARRVFFAGGGYAEDRQRFLVQKTDFITSRPLKAAVDKALARCNLALDDIRCFDLYSCFPSSVAIARNMLGMAEDDPRPLTLTGGLGFFGGPGNNYSLHAIVTLADAIADGRTQNGMVTGLGWFMHKHAAGIYSCEPGDTDFAAYDLEDLRAPALGDPPVAAVDAAAGRGTMETYTVVFTRDGLPDHAILYGRTEDGRRFVARSRPGDDDMIAALTSGCRVGWTVRLAHDGGRGLNLASLV